MAGEVKLHTLPTTAGLHNTQSSDKAKTRRSTHTHEREIERKESVGLKPFEGETVGVLGG